MSEKKRKDGSKKDALAAPKGPGTGLRLPAGRAKTHGGYSFLSTGKLPEHRREVSRYLTAVREGLIRDLGPKEADLSAGQRILIDRVVTKLGVIRCMEEHVREGSVMSGDDLTPCLKTSYLAYNNSVRLDLTALGIDKRAEAKVLDLAEYVQAADAAKSEKDAASARPRIPARSPVLRHLDAMARAKTCLRSSRRAVWAMCPDRKDKNMKDQRLITEFQKNSQELIKVHLQTFRAQEYVDIRAWIKDEKSGEYKATLKGLTLHVELLPELIGALKTAEAALNE